MSFKDLLGPIIIITLVFFLSAFIIFLYQHASVYTPKISLEKLDNLYQFSQFAPAPENRLYIIQDEDLYAYAGWKYLATGQIDTINIEHPPLGKYLIGLSILATGNQNIGQIFWGISFLILFFILGQRMLKSRFLSLFVVIFIFQEGLFKEQLTHSLLDIIQGTFLLALWLITFAKVKPKFKLLWQGIFLGCIASIKFPSIAVISLMTLFIFNFFTNKHRLIRNTLIVSFIAGTVYLLSYLPFFLKNPNPLSFYNLQIKALKIQLSHVPEYPKGQVFNVLLFDRWLSWWGEKNYIKTGFWNLLWPILTINLAITVISNFKKQLLISLWVLLYLLFLAARLFFPRYLLLLLPFLYLQLCYNLKSYLVSRKLFKT